MKYVSYINHLIKQVVAKQDQILLFGQNIAAGSCLSGLTQGVVVGPRSRMINTPNSENTLCGIGFGCMLNGVDAIYFVKQLDFLLLGIDHFVNTYNIVRRKEPAASFTIFPIIVDSGYEGPQSSLNNLCDFCSIARVPGYTMTNRADASEIITRHLVSPGFRILGVSQRLFKSELIEVESCQVFEDGGICQYSDGTDVTVVCCNLSLSLGWELQKALESLCLRPALFSVNAAMPVDWKVLLKSLHTTKRLVILDDSHSCNAPWQGFLNAAHAEVALEACIKVLRSFVGYYLRPNADQLVVDVERIVKELGFSNVLRG
ncbi:MAG: hypothetical protein ACYC3X_22290 [Pirellulaceae bacterium]